MIMRWISDVPSKIVKLVEVRAVSACGPQRLDTIFVSVNISPSPVLMLRLADFGVAQQPLGGRVHG
jgi:hypothetical protein